MPVLTLFSSIYCQSNPIRERLARETGYNVLTDMDIVGRAAELSGIEAKKILAVFTAKRSIFNQIALERERITTWLRLAVAEKLFEKNLIIEGFCGLLVPSTISHVLRIGVTAGLASRLKWGEAIQEGLSRQEIRDQIHQSDEDCNAWFETLFKCCDPWDPQRYDILLSRDEMTDEECLELIGKMLPKGKIEPVNASQNAVKDFFLQARVAVALAQEGHHVDVTAENGQITITIHKKVLMLNRLKEELNAIAEKIEGVISVETHVYNELDQADIYRKFDSDTPKLLLVDDEREYIQALSERLLMRDLHSATAYDGESALNILNEDEPEVIILDLRMPGIGGIEVLRQVKTNCPAVEVIILTGHGSETDRKLCLSLGAFAYLQKPVDIEVLTTTLKQANAKIRRDMVH